MKKMNHNKKIFLDRGKDNDYYALGCRWVSVAFLYWLRDTERCGMEPYDLGYILRSMRLEKRLTLKQVSERSNYSVSYISQIERGQANPSVGTLQTITQALGETFASLFQTERSSAPPHAHTISAQGSTSDQVNSHFRHSSRVTAVVRKDQRKGLILPGTSYEQQLLGPDLNRKIEFLWTRISPGLKTGVYQHQGEECGVIIKGTLVCRVGGETFTLHAGDSIYFDSSNPHEFENESKETVETIWAITPPSF